MQYTFITDLNQFVIEFENHLQLFYHTTIPCMVMKHYGAWPSFCVLRNVVNED